MVRLRAAGGGSAQGDRSLGDSPFHKDDAVSAIPGVVHIPEPCDPLRGDCLRWHLGPSVQFRRRRHHRPGHANVDWSRPPHGSCRRCGTAPRASPSSVRTWPSSRRRRRQRAKRCLIESTEGRRVASLTVPTGRPLNLRGAPEQAVTASHVCACEPVASSEERGLLPCPAGAR